MEKKKITVTIKDGDGKVLLEYSEPVEISRGAMENITWIKKGVWTIKELLNINISQELDRARKEERKKVGKEIVNLFIGINKWMSIQPGLKLEAVTDKVLGDYVSNLLKTKEDEK